MRLVDSRRLRGPNLQTHEPAAVAEVLLDAGERPSAAIRAWREALAWLAGELGWASYARTAVARPFPGGVAFALPAPIDGLLTATEVNEAAIRIATATLGINVPELDEGAPTLEELRVRIAEERSPRLVALHEEAQRRGIAFLWDDDSVTLGMARRSVTFPSGELPDPSTLEWSALGSIPVALVTGTNGKTTTARLLARMAKLAGRVAGNTSTDGIAIDERLVEEGDWTGAEAARLVLRRPDVELAILETARGGILRRGLAIEACDAALITNVTSDHLGEFGVCDVATMARAKAVVGTIVRPDGRVVLNGDDPLLAAMTGAFRAKVVLFGLAAGSEALRAHRARGGEIFTVRDGVFLRSSDEGERTLGTVADAPLTFGGAARYNVANCLAAAAVAWSLGLPDAAVVEALHTFGRTLGDNPGRGEIVRARSGAQVILDFGHNPAGMRELLRLAATRVGPGGLVASVHTQPGDRTQADAEALAIEIAAASPRLVVLWESEHYRRGREVGDIALSLRTALVAAGVADDAIAVAESEVAALDRALVGTGPGDVVVVAPHIDRESVAASSLLGDS